MKYMVTISFKQSPDAEMAALIPAEQARVKELREQGTLEAIYISAERSKVWLVLQGESQAEVDQAVASLPLHPYMNTETIALL